jgi:hypothetical protein
MFQRLEIPSKDPNNWTHNPIDRSEQQSLGVSSWYTQFQSAKWKKEPSEWGKWYSDCRKTVEKIKQRRDREALAESQGTTPRQVTVRKCGFCGSIDHTRRNCGLMETFKAQAIKANQEWRRQFHERFVTELGISEGALLNVKRRTWGRDPEPKPSVAIVTSINWGELSICNDGQWRGTSNYRGDIDYSLRQNVNLSVSVGGHSHVLSIGNDSITNLGMNSIVSKPHNDNMQILGVLSPSERPMDVEWVNQGHEDAVNFITKKRNYQKLKELGYVGVVEKWYKQWAINNVQ